MSTSSFGMGMPQASSLLDHAASAAAMTKKYAREAQNYNDLGALQGLKSKGADKEEALRTVAKQFESLMMNEVLKTMRAANEVFAKDNPFNSSATEMYQDMMDKQLTLNMSAGRGSGLADMLVRQLGGDQKPALEDGVSAAIGSQASGGAVQTDRNWRSLDAIPRNAPAVGLRETEQRILDQVDALVVDADRFAVTRNEDAQPSVEAAATSVVAKPVVAAIEPERFETPADFVRTLLPHARKTAAAIGADERVLLAQAALETGWGKHMITDANGAPSYNLFGIKAGSQWQGRTTDILTTEYREGSAVKERAAFRAYDSYEDSFADYLDFLSSKPRYAQALAAAGDHVGFSNALQKAGYATDPEYASKIQRIVQSDYLDDAGTGIRPSGEQASR